MIDAIPDFLLLTGVIIVWVVLFVEIRKKDSIFLSLISSSFKARDSDRKELERRVVFSILGGCLFLGVLFAFLWSVELVSLLLRSDQLSERLTESLDSLGIWGPVLFFSGIFLLGVAIRVARTLFIPKTNREAPSPLHNLPRWVSLWFALSAFLFSGYYFLKGFESEPSWGMAGVWAVFVLLNLYSALTSEQTPPAGKEMEGSPGGLGA